MELGQIHPKTEELIENVLSKIPEEVSAFVYKKVYFTESVQGDTGEINCGFCFCVKADVYKYHIYFDSYFSSLSRKEKLYVIAHEISHAYFEHATKEIGIKEEEKEADDFAAKYGFPRPRGYNPVLGKDYARVWKIITPVLTITVIIYLILFDYFYEVNYIGQFLDRIFK